MKTETGTGNDQLKLEISGSGMREVRSVARRKLGQLRIELTARDFEILRFIVDMKFASSREIFEKFFKMRMTNEPAASDSFTKKRLLKLEKSGFLRSTYSFAEASKYFIATYKTYRALANFAPEHDLGRPYVAFDQRTFLHDKLVLLMRLKFERELGAKNWISDRVLKSGRATEFGGSSLYIPDAIYELPSGERIAFELEIARKTRAKYQEKVQNYVSLLRDPSEEHPRITRVHYVCFRKQPFEILKSETDVYGNLFHLELAEFSTYLKRGAK